MSYCDIKNVVEAGGFFHSVADLESVGTGDGSTTNFNLEHNPVVEGSLTVYKDGVQQTENTDYTVNYTTGEISFTTAPSASEAVTATYWYYSGEVDNTVVQNRIDAAEAMVAMYTGRTYDQTTTTEYYDGNDKTFLITHHYPIISVDALTVDGTTISPSTLYIYNSYGKIEISTDSEVSGFTSTEPQNVVLTYTYGYASVPAIIKELTIKLAARDTLVGMMGGTSDDITQWQVGDMEMAMGEPYVNMMRTLERLDLEIRSIISQLKKSPVVG